MVNESLKIELHFQCAVPVFKGEHGAPVQPESGMKYFIVKNIFDFFVIEILVLCHKQLHDLHTAFLAEIKFTVSVSVLTTINSGAAERIHKAVLFSASNIRKKQKLQPQ